MGAVNERLVAWLRTVFPVGWAALIAWLVTRIPVLEPVRDWLAGLGEPALTLLVGAVVHPVLRWVESRPWLPDWLTRVFLGSAKPPTYREA